MKSVATIILNRNLPEVTNRLYEFLEESNGDVTDIYVVESGSEKHNLSKHYTWWANWEESLEHGLRYPRGFNYGLSMLWKDGKFTDYEYYFLVCNDVEFNEKRILHVLLETIQNHPRVGILAPCSPAWGEKELIGDVQIKYFWYVQFYSWLIRRDMVGSVMEQDDPSYTNFLFDGQNFRGYEADIEVVAKGYANDWATAITTRATQRENESYLKTRADLMKTDFYDENLKNVLNEGKKWLRRKYGFNSRRTMQLYANFFYDKFFEFYPEFTQYKI